MPLLRPLHRVGGCLEKPRLVGVVQVLVVQEKKHDGSHASPGYQQQLPALFGQQQCGL